jgi:hypothetical protein
MHACNRWTTLALMASMVLAMCDPARAAADELPPIPRQVLSGHGDQSAAPLRDAAVRFGATSGSFVSRAGQPTPAPVPTRPRINTGMKVALALVGVTTVSVVAYKTFSNHRGR